MKVVIVGGSAGGVSASVRLRRLDERTEILLLGRGMDLARDCRSLPDHRTWRSAQGMT